MSNLDKAEELLSQFDWPCSCPVEQIVSTLADAGLLAPDLPEPESVIEGGLAYWNEETVHCQVGSGRIRLWNEDSRLDSSEARELAYALLAAANHAEEQE